MLYCGPVCVRFTQEAEAVSVNRKVMNLRCALDEAVNKNQKAREVCYNRTTLLFYQGMISYSIKAWCDYSIRTLKPTENTAPPS